MSGNPTFRKYFFAFLKSIDPSSLKQPDKGQNDRNRHGQSDKFRRISIGAGKVWGATENGSLGKDSTGRKEELTEEFLEKAGNNGA